MNRFVSFKIECDAGKARFRIGGKNDRIVFFVRYADAADFENGFVVIIRCRDGGKQGLKRAEQKKKAFHITIIGKTAPKIYRTGKRT